jgi:aryl-alcohol dehydrogenase-like predicted oxidoreductase
MMKKRLLGRTGAEVSVLGLGDIADRSIPLEHCVATLHRAMDRGLSLVDTAPGYENGYSEQIVGTALKGRREGMFVIDKIDDLAAPVSPQVDSSLRALGIRRILLNESAVFSWCTRPGRV